MQENQDQEGKVASKERIHQHNLAIQDHRQGAQQDTKQKQEKVKRRKKSINLPLYVFHLLLQRPSHVQLPSILLSLGCKLQTILYSKQMRLFPRV
jgi:ribosomal protein L24